MVSQQITTALFEIYEFLPANPVVKGNILELVLSFYLAPVVQVIQFFLLHFVWTAFFVTTRVLIFFLCLSFVTSDATTAFKTFSLKLNFRRFYVPLSLA